MDQGDLVAIIAISIWSRPLKIPFAKHARSFERSAWLQLFLKIDLFKGYHQISFAAADITKMAIIVPFGLLEYLFTPFELSHTTQTFQHMMDRTVDGLESVFAYMDDDSRVDSLDRQTHHLHFEAFFNALATNGLTINLKKCVFEVPTLEILGHMISATGSAPTAGHAAAIESCPPPPKASSNCSIFSAW
jgi:hypothetical protein